MMPGYHALCFRDKQNTLHVDCKDYFFVGTELFKNLTVVVSFY